MQFVLKCSLLVKIVCILLNIEQYLQTAFNVHNCQASLLVIFLWNIWHMSHPFRLSEAFLVLMLTNIRQLCYWLNNNNDDTCYNGFFPEQPE